MEIPHKEDYEKFLNEFSNGLKFIKGISFFIYGSYLRDDFVPGRSDVNGFLVLNDDFVTNKNSINSLADILIKSLDDSNKNIITKFKVLDKGTALDGRFLTYSEDYVGFLKKNAIIKSGKYNLEDMNGSDYKNPERVSISNNLNDIRKGFFYNEFNYYLNKRDFYDNVIKKLSQLPRQLITLSENKLIEKKDESLETFSKEFPDYDCFFMKEVNELMNDSIKYENFFNEEHLSENECFSFSLKCLTEMERMIKVYTEKFPKVSVEEVKDILSN
jgi:hypothetical protein